MFFSYFLLLCKPDVNKFNFFYLYFICIIFSFFIVEELLHELSEIEDEKKSMKRKHQANVKELTRQLQQARKRLESVDSRNNTEGGNCGGLGSRASSKSNSNQSLDTAGVEANNPTPAPPTEEEVILPNGPVDQRVLFSKIIKLQKKVARYSDKVEFLEDHNAQLTNDIRRKSRIIQKYILREESGTLTPASADVSKVNKFFFNTITIIYFLTTYQKKL